jgi:hypothetical protein
MAVEEAGVWSREKVPDNYTIVQRVCKGKWTYLHTSPRYVTLEVTAL